MVQHLGKVAAVALLMGLDGLLVALWIVDVCLLTQHSRCKLAACHTRKDAARQMYLCASLRVVSAQLGVEIAT